MVFEDGERRKKLGGFSSEPAIPISSFSTPSTLTPRRGTLSCDDSDDVPARVPSVVSSNTDDEATASSPVARLSAAPIWHTNAVSEQGTRGLGRDERGVRD